MVGLTVRLTLPSPRALLPAWLKTRFLVCFVAIKTLICLSNDLNDLNVTCTVIKMSKCVKLKTVENGCKTATTKQCCVTMPSYSVLIRFEEGKIDACYYLPASAPPPPPSASQRQAIKWVNTCAHIWTHKHTTATSGCGCLSFFLPPSLPLSLSPSRLISH